ncbi:MAG: hypothetical protein D0433_05720, partial [Candidatus Thermochlorobacter aerophilum]
NYFYPLAQAMDSVELKNDVELGGTDQKFNCWSGAIYSANMASLMHKSVSHCRFLKALMACKKCQNRSITTSASTIRRVRCISACSKCQMNS